MSMRLRIHSFPSECFFCVAFGVSLSLLLICGCDRHDREDASPTGVDDVATRSAGALQEMPSDFTDVVQLREPAWLDRMRGTIVLGEGRKLAKDFVREVLLKANSSMLISGEAMGLEDSIWWPRIEAPALSILVHGCEVYGIKVVRKRGIGTAYEIYVTVRESRE